MRRYYDPSRALSWLGVALAAMGIVELFLAQWFWAALFVFGGAALLWVGGDRG